MSTPAEIVRQSLLLAVARQDAISALLAEHGGVDGFAAYLDSPEGESKLEELAMYADADAEMMVAPDDALSLITLDTMMELDVLQRLAVLEELVDEVE